MSTNTSINANSAARARWEPYWMIANITIQPVREAVAEIVGILERKVATLDSRAPRASCMINLHCFALNGITLEFFLIRLEKALTKILLTSDWELEGKMCADEESVRVVYAPKK